MNGENDWGSWRNHVLAEQKRMNCVLEKHLTEETIHREELVRVRITIAGLKASARVWGGLAGLLVAALLQALSRAIHL